MHTHTLLPCPPAVLQPGSASELWLELPLLYKSYVAARVERSGATALLAAQRRGGTALSPERVCLFCGQEVTD